MARFDEILKYYPCIGIGVKEVHTVQITLVMNDVTGFACKCMHAYSYTYSFLCTCKMLERDNKASSR